MSTIIESTFTQYKQTDQETLAGSSLTTDQKQFIQTQCGMLAESILALTPDPTSYNIFIQQEAFLKGQLAAYKYLLDCSNASEQALLELALTQSTSQSQL